MNYTLTDMDGRIIEVGARVRAWDYLPWHPHWPAHEMYCGTVTEITEWEGDCDDEGRSVQIAPRVIVMFDDKTDDDFPTSEWKFDFVGGFDVDGEPWGGDEPISSKVEELCVIGPPDVGHVRLGLGPINTRLYLQNMNKSHPTWSYAITATRLFVFGKGVPVRFIGDPPRWRTRRFDGKAENAAT